MDIKKYKCKEKNLDWEQGWTRSRGNADLEERWAGAKVGRVTSYLAAES